MFAKENDKVIRQDIYEKYDSQRGERGVMINMISDDHVNFGAQLMAGKLLRKCGKD